jgi:hypothetical protein
MKSMRRDSIFNHLEKNMEANPSLRSTLIPALLACISIAPAFAMGADASVAPPLASGWWEITTRPEFPGVPMIPVPKIDKLCLAAEDIATGRIPLRSAPGCTVQGGKWQEKRLQLNIVCRDAPADAQITGTLDANEKSLAGEITIVSQPSQEGPAAARFTYRHTGKWLAADCPAAPPPAPR